MPPTVRVVSAEESAARDRAAIERGVPSQVLMQRAGTGAAHIIMHQFSEGLRDGALVVVGPGNNGGDGWVVAGALAREGIAVCVRQIAEPKTPEARAQREAALASVKVSDGPTDAGVVVDAVLGTGSVGEPRGRIAEAIAQINIQRAQNARIASLDIPSGLNATTGAHTKCVVADMTLTFDGLKRGMLLARDCCGEIIVIDIGLDEAASDRSRPRKSENTDAAANTGTPLPNLPTLIEREWVHEHLPGIRYDAHKGERKHLALVGGGRGMPGAMVLAARAALRSGVGLLRVIVSPENISAVLNAVPSALISEWPTADADMSSEISKWADAVVVGPGLGKTSQARSLIEKILGDSDVPALLDADALNLFERRVGALSDLLAGRPALITPHVAEFARLANVDVSAVVDGRFDIGADLARTLKATVLLKGSPTVVFTPSGDRFVVARGTAALGTGGSGDLLAGIAGTLLAQTGNAATAASCAAWIHGRAAEMCSYVRGTTLEDVLYALPRAWNESAPALEPPLIAQLPAVAS